MNKIYVIVKVSPTIFISGIPTKNHQTLTKQKNGDQTPKTTELKSDTFTKILLHIINNYLIY